MAKMLMETKWEMHLKLFWSNLEIMDQIRQLEVVPVNMVKKMNSVHHFWVIRISKIIMVK